MNWNQVQDRWQQFAGRMKSKLATGSYEDLSKVGMRDLLIRELRARYDGLKVAAREQIAFWYAKPAPAAQAKAEPSDGKAV